VAGSDSSQSPARSGRKTLPTGGARLAVSQGGEGGAGPVGPRGGGTGRGGNFWAAGMSSGPQGERGKRKKTDWAEREGERENLFIF